jgi:hypothetical protein
LHCTIVRSASFAEVDDSYDPYRTEYIVIELAAALEIGNAE